MGWKRVYGVFCSPCGSTERILRRICEGLGTGLCLPVEYWDYTMSAGRERVLEFGTGDLVVWGTPVYAGRVPNKFVGFIRDSVRGNGCAVIPVVVYGNRDFDDALSELKMELERNGCRAIAAAAVVSRHCFSDSLAAGRPDSRDWKQIELFTETVIRTIRTVPEKMLRGEVAVPGKCPPTSYYIPKGVDGSPAVFLKAIPVFDTERCTRCGICSKVCPMDSISIDDVGLPYITGICIKCHSCISKCPSGAISFTDPAFLSHKEMLEISFAKRREPTFYYAAGADGNG